MDVEVGQRSRSVVFRTAQDICLPKLTCNLRFLRVKNSFWRRAILKLLEYNK